MGNENKKGNYLVGARTLSKNEIEKVLPTYEKIFSDIEIIREGFELSAIKDSEKIIRRTNSIGIMGKRGTGKTSILHSIRNRLMEEWNQDIVLDIIVPDNMSEKSELLGNIIGRFNSEIEELEKVAKRNEGKENKLGSSFYDATTCRFKKDNVLREAYKKMVTAYCYMQPEYRDLLIRNYTDLPSYISKSGEVFNADTEFIKKFNDFIYQLVKVKMEQNNNKKVLIHIFIDDIDLAPHRCPQIAKALLAYLAHPAIVVHLSGDIETFEEALTLQFLTQNDELIPIDILKEKFVESKSLLKRKKELAYDYMKKIIPANYRHSLRCWELKSRGEYSISNGKGEEQKEITLRELLIEVLGDESVGKLFTCFVYKDDKLMEEKENLAMGYQIFDERSRGLNNVYRSLIQMKQIKDNNSNDSKQIYILKKVLIEIIISSNPYLNSNRHKIEKIILWGDNEETAIIRADNLWRQMRDVNLADLNEVISEFALFELIYLITCIIPKVDCDKLLFEKSKKIGLFMLLVNPVLNGSTLKFEETLILKWGRQLGIEIEENEERDYQEENENSWKERQWIAYIEGFIMNSDFAFALHYYQAMIQTIGYMFNNGSNEQYIVILIEALKTYAGKNADKLLMKWWEDDNKKDLLYEMYRVVNISEQNMMYKFLLGNLENKIEKIICKYTKEALEQGNDRGLKKLYNQEHKEKCNKIVSDGGIIIKENETAELRYMEYKEIYKNIYPSIVSWLIKTLGNRIDISHITINSFKEGFSHIIEKDSVKLLIRCAEEKLWDKNWSQDLLTNNINHIGRLFEKILFDENTINTEALRFVIHDNLYNQISKFLEIYSNDNIETIVVETVSKIKNIFWDDKERAYKISSNISIEQYLKLIIWIRKVRENLNIEYDKRRVNKILNELSKMEVKIGGDKESLEVDEIMQRLSCYIIYLRQTRKDIDDISKIVHKLNKFSRDLDIIEQMSDQNVTDEIKRLLDKEDIDMSEIFAGSGELNEASN